MALNTHEITWQEWQHIISLRVFLFEELGGMIVPDETYGSKIEWGDKIWYKTGEIVKDRSWH